MTLPYPSLPGEGTVTSDEILFFYPIFIDYLKNSVRSLQSPVRTLPLIWLTLYQ